MPACVSSSLGGRRAISRVGFALVALGGAVAWALLRSHTLYTSLGSFLHWFFMQPPPTELRLSMFLLLVASVLAWGACLPLSHLLSLFLSETYRQASYYTRVEWNCRAVSTLHALESGLLALWIVLFDSSIGSPPFWAFSPWIVTVHLLTSGYLIYDSIAMVIYRHIFFAHDCSALIHHIFGAFAFFFSMGYRQCTYFLILALLTEASTPFVHRRWYLAATKQEKSKSYVINGLLLFLVFGAFRLPLAPYISYVIWKWFNEFRLLTPFAQASTYLLVGTIGCINNYWFFLIGRGFLRAVHRRQQEFAKEG